MIDLEKARIAYKEFASKYVKENNPKIMSKIRHMNRVADNSKILAESLELDEEQTKLAELIGLLHDIGRFEQLRIYNTYLDYKSIDHAKQGIITLFDEGHIRDFVEDDKYDNIIYKAIWNHNKYKIEEGLTGVELLHSKIIRDADKIDIYNIIVTEGLENHTSFESKDFSKETLNDEIYNDFLKNHVVDYKKMKNNVDYIVAWLGYSFDINFKKSYEIIQEKQYVHKVATLIDYKDELTKTRMHELENITEKHIEESIL